METLTEKEKKSLHELEWKVSMPKWKYYTLVGLTFIGISVIGEYLFDLLQGDKFQFQNDDLGRTLVSAIIVMIVLRLLNNSEYKRLIKKRDGITEQNKK